MNLIFKKVKRNKNKTFSGDSPVHSPPNPTPIAHNKNGAPSRSHLSEWQVEIM